MSASDLEAAAAREAAEQRARVEDLVVWSALDQEDPDQAVAEQKKPVDVAVTPWPSWNRACRDEGGGKGAAMGWTLTGAATTGTGKSILGLNFARVNVVAGRRVGYLSLEMSERQLRTRFLAMLANEPVAQLERGRQFNEATLRRALEKARQVHREAGGRLYTSSRQLYALPEILDAMEELHHGSGCTAFVVDYLQLGGNPNDPESITAIAHAIRRMTQRLNVATLGLSQFNRMTSTNGTRPTIHGLMGGSALENDSDQVVIIDQTTIDREGPPAPLCGWDALAVLAKNRHGPSGVEIPIRFNSRTLRMEERTPDEMPSTARDG